MTIVGRSRKKGREVIKAMDFVVLFLLLLLLLLLIVSIEGRREERGRERERNKKWFTNPMPSLHLHDL
jgi:hypothetical protein